MEVIEQTLSGSNTVGASASSGTCTISRNGDLVGRVYVTSSTAGIANGDAIVSEVDLEKLELLKFSLPLSSLWMFIRNQRISFYC